MVGFGVAVSGNEDVLIDRVRVHDTAKVGLAMEDALGFASMTVNESLIEGSGEIGISVGW